MCFGNVLVLIFPQFAPGQAAPNLVLGEKFVPGSDNGHFCQPTSVAVVEATGDFFVADGYCNSRVMKFDRHGNLLNIISKGCQNSCFVAFLSLFFFYWQPPQAATGRWFTAWPCSRRRTCSACPTATTTRSSASAPASGPCAAIRRSPPRRTSPGGPSSPTRTSAGLTPSHPRVSINLGSVY